MQATPTPEPGVTKTVQEFKLNLDLKKLTPELTLHKYVNFWNEMSIDTNANTLLQTLFAVINGVPANQVNDFLAKLEAKKKTPERTLTPRMFSSLSSYPS